MWQLRRHTIWVVICSLLLSWPPPAGAEGSRDLAPAESPAAFRASIEWMASSYNRHLLRRTLLRVFARRGEYILVASSAVGVRGSPSQGDIWVYDPGLVTGPVGREAFPPEPSFSCVTQRTSAGNGGRGRIASRAQELAGPNAPDGYLPCYYRAPATGIYHVGFLGPAGPASAQEGGASGRIEATEADFGPEQQTSVTAWEVLVADSIDTAVEHPGRLFTYYIAGSTGGNGRSTSFELYTVTNRGFAYRNRFLFDPGSFVLYANQLGFIDGDGRPLYRNVLADPSLPAAAQDRLERLQGGVALAPPKHPLFFDRPDAAALEALGLPAEAQLDAVGPLRFVGPSGGITAPVGAGGEFEFTVDGAAEDVYLIVVSYDGLNFDPKNPDNALIRGFAPAMPGTLRVVWDGKDSSGRPFPVGNFLARVVAQQGEVHFPLLDAENSLEALAFELLNPPDVDGDGVDNCPPWSGGCFSIFYDARGYRTADGTLVGLGVNGPLCPEGAGNPPEILATDQLIGADSRTMQMRWGFPADGDAATVCAPDGGFGDKKGVDFWTYYPSLVQETPLRIVAPLQPPSRLFLPLLRH